ncbi:hypothetical protein GPECTOR_80g170 [Gonium pectorale]|uniref:Uncharacterized protein n=1 Tax=Gonium pectorale TaxID=33097 RepID=A0A150G3C3_GONPE|nr:hypothetical protein GPECTOR_80g170 [Gonium pectorale]|eukprot:KXZ43810.1 hypothetical protein GPECTOR_80g170 [Gonium pectorale]
MSAAERSSAATAAARSGLLRCLNASARLAARRGGAEALAPALGFPQPLRALLLPAAVEVTVLRPELADACGSSSGNGSGGGGEAAVWRPGVELGLFVTLAKATRLLCNPEAEAVSAAAPVALALFHTGSLVAEGVVLCPQVGGQQLPRGSLTPEAAARREALRAVLVRCAAASVPPFVLLMDALAAAYGSSGRWKRQERQLLREASAAAATTVLKAFEQGLLLLRRLLGCVPAAAVQRLLGPDLLLRLTAAAGRLFAALKPRAPEPDYGPLLAGLLTAPALPAAAVAAAASSGGAAAAALAGALPSAAYHPAMALAQAAAHEALCPGVWAALRALPAAAAGCPTGTAAAAASQDLTPLVGVVRQHEHWQAGHKAECRSLAAEVEAAEATAEASPDPSNGPGS